MAFKCLCGTTFEVTGENTVIPGHEIQAGKACAGSGKTVKNINRIKAGISCPLTMGRDYCPFCQTTPCLTKDQDAVSA